MTNFSCYREEPVIVHGKADKVRRKCLKYAAPVLIIPIWDFFQAAWHARSNVLGVVVDE